MDFPQSSYDYCEHNSINELENPPVDFEPIYSWCWSGEITKEGVSSRLDEMEERGIRRLYVIAIPSEFTGIECERETRYLSGEYLELCEFLASEAKRRGMKLWLYDEGGYPSGAANGRVVNENPHLKSLSIDAEGKIVESHRSAQPYPDLLKAESTEKFIEYTHEVYKGYFGASLGEHFPVVFTDEARVPLFRKTVAYSEELEALFEERFGYGMRDHFAALFDEELTDDRSREVRADFHRLLGDLFSENYFGRIRRWCDENGILFTGHLGGDDVAFGNAKWGYYNIMKCLREMHIPGVDAIWRQIFPAPVTEGIEPYAPLCANSSFPRYASSSAHQTGARLSLTESYAIYGAGLTYDQMRWVYNFQLVRGINVLNPMSICYTHAGRYATQVGLPSFSSPAPGASDLGEFNRWASRASYLMSAGKPIADSALYMPLADIWPADRSARECAEAFEALASSLEAKGCDIDFIDDDAILAAKIVDGALKIGDACYKVLYFQPNVTHTAAVSEKLGHFLACGGKAVVCEGDYDCYPIIIDERGQTRATRRTVSEGRLYYLTSEAHGASRGEVYFPLESGRLAYEIDLLTAERRVVSVDPYRYDLSLGGESVLLFTGDVTEAEEDMRAEWRTVREISDFTLTPITKIEITPNGIESKKCNEAPTAAVAGDWRCYLGEGFSGDAEYKTRLTFKDGAPKAATLELPSVGYSCEVFLNGRSLGAKIFSPFVYDLTGLLEENELVIRVSNTMANAYAVADLSGWISDYEPDYMKKLELGFEGDSLASGLLAPVLIKY